MGYLHAPLPGLDLHDDGCSARVPGRARGQAHRRPRESEILRAKVLARASCTRLVAGINCGGNPMAYFAKFTERGQRALAGSAGARRLSWAATYVGTEHLLLGVLTEPGAATMVLRGHYAGRGARGDRPDPRYAAKRNSQGKQMVYTPRTKKVLEQSVREARELKQNYVSTEHHPAGPDARARGRGRACADQDGRGSVQGAGGTSAHPHAAATIRPAPTMRAGDMETPLLDQFSRDLTKAARAGELDPVIGRGEGDRAHCADSLPPYARTTPCSSASPAWASPPLSKDWPS